MTRGSSGNNNPNNPNSNFIHHSIGKSQIESVKNRAQQQQQQQRPNMDPEYYFRPRVAALASAQMEYAGTPVGSARGSLASHLDTIGVNSGAAAAVQRANQGGGGEPMVDRRYVNPAAAASNTSGINSVSVSRLQAAGGKEKYGERRNPTILRKKLDVCIYLMSAVGIKLEVEDGASVTCGELINTLTEEDELNLPRQATEVFSLWMTSPLLEVQLKPHHKPFYIRREWNHFLQRFSSAPLEKKTIDEPILSFQRNVFFHKRDEVKIRDSKVLEFLYEEAKYNILTGRYPCEISDYIMLGGIQARLELGPYNPDTHTLSFMKAELYRFLPEHAAWSSSWTSCLSPPWRASKNSPEARLIEQFKAIPSNAGHNRLVRKYLQFCWTLPYYGSAFFHGQIETPTRSLTSLVINHDTEAVVAINTNGLYVIDPLNVVVLLGLKLEELSWDYAKPSQENNEDCLPCLFIQFCVIENGRRVSKILQIFSRQAVQMDALINTFVDELKQRVAMYNEDHDGNVYGDSTSTDADDCLVPLTTVSRRGIPESCLSNKLNRLTLATFDDEGKKSK